MRDEVYIKLDADTLRMIREENLPNLQPFDTEVTKLCVDTEAHHAAKDLGRKPSKIENSLYMDPGNFIEYVHVYDDELPPGDDQLVRDMVRTLNQKLNVKKVDYLTKIGDKIVGRTVERNTIGIQTHHVESIHWPSAIL